MWAAGRAEIAAGKVDADPVPDATSLRWGVSIVATIAPPLAVTLEALANSCCYLCGDDHTFYNRANLHLTVRSCEFHRIAVAQGDAAIRAYGAVLAEVGREHDPLEVAYCGLNANRTGIICQGYPLSETLQTLRGEIHRRLARLGFREGPEGDGVRRTAHISLVVFGGPVADPPALAGWLGADRETWFGATRITRLSLVKYRRTAHDVELIRIGEVALGQES